MGTYLQQSHVGKARATYAEQTAEDREDYDREDGDDDTVTGRLVSFDISAWRVG